MVMSNYMDLLGMYAPWFLILFMVVPMTLAELVLCSEIFSLLNKEKAENSQVLCHFFRIVRSSC